MRIVETVFPLKVPQTPRVFTIECNEDELKVMLDWYWYTNDEFVPNDEDYAVRDTLATAL